MNKMTLRKVKLKLLKNSDKEDFKICQRKKINTETHT